MSKKELQVTCPCCSSRLVVDLRTERVVSSRREEELDETGKPVVTEGDWTTARDRVRDREEGGDGRLTDALDREKGRESRLDDLFKQAKDKLYKDQREPGSQ